jgi:hypothetical protein
MLFDVAGNIKENEDKKKGLALKAKPSSKGYDIVSSRFNFFRYGHHRKD